MKPILKPIVTCSLYRIFFLFFAATFLPNVLGKENRKPDTEQTSLTLIKDVNVLTVSEHRTLTYKKQSVLIKGKKIARVVADDSLPPTAGVTVIDGRNKFLLPGLIDAHVHVWDEADLLAYLAHGVTTVRNASGMPFHLTFAHRIETGQLEGPRLLTTGPILNGKGPNTQLNHQIVNNASEAKSAVQKQYKQGFRLIKVYSNLSREAYEAILVEARRLGMTVMGHTPEGLRAAGVPTHKPFDISFNEILDDGFVSIEHMESIVWHAMSDRLDENAARELARSLAKHAIVVTPTLIAHHNLVLLANQKQRFLQRTDVNLLNPFIVKFEQESYTFWLRQNKESRQNFDDFYARATKIFHEEGVKLIAGSDSGIFTNIPGVSLHEELALMVKSGLSPAQALATATINAAETLGLGDNVGQIKEGFAADLILLEKDPTKSIEAIRAPAALMVAGRWYDSNDIMQLKRDAVSQASYSRTERRIKEGLAAQGN